MYPILDPDFLQASRHANDTTEATFVAGLLADPPYHCDLAQTVQRRAGDMVEQLRQKSHQGGLVGAFLAEYGLTDQEGVALMCLAESVLRIPDARTREQLIADKIGGANWQAHLGQADSLWVNASTWALLLTSKVAAVDDTLPGDVLGWLGGLSTRLSMPVVQQAVRGAIRVLGSEFVFSESIEAAVADASGSFSFDMLGEGARDEQTAQGYFDAYAHAISTVAARNDLDASVSIKLSALHPRVEYGQRRRLRRELLPRLTALCALAQSHGVALTIDAEESFRLLPTLELYGCLLADPSLQQATIGLVVQAYSKRASVVLDWLAAQARASHRQLPVRLVKGAYWDAEIKHAQERGLSGFPVFTRKAHTDLNYLHCARQILAAPELFGQFATHNAHTMAAIHRMAGDRRDFEFQRLHGMGEDVVAVAQAVLEDLPAVRVYAPIGEYKDLLAYLIRRLLENGANSSFVHKLYDADIEANALVADPVQKVIQRQRYGVHPDIRLPDKLYDSRENSPGLDLDEPLAVKQLYQALREHRHGKTAWPRHVLTPREAFDKAGSAFNEWSNASVEHRAACLRRLADLLLTNQHTLVAMLAEEAHKTLPDGVAEVREAVDFCRYYAQLAELQMVARTQPGITGETNTLTLHGRGVWVCISPWNFPLAIFLGQVSAALVTGNTVVAKPSEFTPLIAEFVSALISEAGFPEGVFNLVIGDAQLGRALIEDAATAGVAFTGSTRVAREINQLLAARSGPIVPLIAETGGQNVMFVDSTALLEEVTDDVLLSAFASAGQRCSALRLLYLQDDIADAAINLIKGGMDQLQIGPAWRIGTDVGPVINVQAAAQLHACVDKHRAAGRLLHQCSMPRGLSKQFVAPALVEVSGIEALEEEKFGPLLHVARIRSEQFDEALEAVNQAGYGLTMGLHTRLQHRIDCVSRRARVGNLYVNRDTVGAVVESQPFGGQGLSGTGPKAGGPFYLQRFVTERVVTVNAVAGGGNRDLLSLD